MVGPTHKSNTNKLTVSYAYKTINFNQTKSNNNETAVYSEMPTNINKITVQCKF